MAGEFYDRARIYVKAGKGGDGMATFRREKHVPRGGPDGGDGGRGGHVYIVADQGLNTLLPFQYQRRFIAEQGGNGGRSRRHGKNGEDLFIKVPPGTVVRVEIEGEQYEVDLESPKMQLRVARGGKGGLGNTHFVSSTYQVPRIAELGEPGEEFELDLELKVLADVGLLGFPNAGKSTLLSIISAAQPKVAPYPFTTLQPNLGVVEVGLSTFVVADIPGLIEGAHRGVGLGFDFLRHIERTRLLIHMVDAAGIDARDPVDDYTQILEEMEQYQPGLLKRPRIVALNKADLPEAQEQIARLREHIELPSQDVFVISAATREGIDALIQRVAAQLAEMPIPPRAPREETFDWPVPEVDPNMFTVEAEGDGWRVRGKRIQTLISKTNFSQAESLMRVQRVLEASGISKALQQAGVEEGDTIYIGDAELVWSDEEFLE